MGRLYVTGYGVERDPKKALEMFERAVKATPPGEEHNQAEEQRAALAGVLDAQATAANAAGACQEVKKPSIAGRLRGDDRRHFLSRAATERSEPPGD